MPSVLRLDQLDRAAQLEHEKGLDSFRGEVEAVTYPGYQLEFTRVVREYVRCGSAGPVSHPCLGLAHGLDKEIMVGILQPPFPCVDAHYTPGQHNYPTKKRQLSQQDFPDLRPKHLLLPALESGLKFHGLLWGQAAHPFQRL